ncbi:MAG TPA: glycerophosphodiester phosphodiesterase family protein [Euzebyales bacterium]|nr:glycerophosphodiester phosphodiesterase family protein [Euzebyales bacterium]
MRHITDAVLVIVCVLTLLPTSASAATHPLGIAHRGSSANCAWTENTVHAFDRCATEADMLEVDLRMSMDGRPVIIHDATLDRTTTAAGRVAERSFSRLRQIPTADGVGRIPSLKVLANIISRSGRMVAIDVKVYPGAKGWRILNSQLGPVRSHVILFSARHNKYIAKAKANGFAAAHYSWPDQPVPTVVQVRRYGDYIWRGPLTDDQVATFHGAGIRTIRRSNSPTAWERFARQRAWAVNTDRIDHYIRWRQGRR